MAVNYRFEITDDNTGEIIKATDEAIERALEALGQQAVGYAKMLTPSDTSNLRNSMTHRVDMEDKVVYVGTDVYYAPYVEYGTGKYGENKKDGWWVYVEGSSTGNAKPKGKRYTKEQAKRIVAILRSKGLKAHMTEGREPVHFLRDAIEKHKDEYKKLAESMLKNI